MSNIRESNFTSSRVNTWLNTKVLKELDTRHLGQSLRRYFMDCLEVLNSGLSYIDTSVPIVEVGSGNGYLGGILKRLYPDRQFVAIDPEPNKWGAVPQNIYDNFSLKATYKTVDDFDGDQSFVILDWPQPELSYDIEAIEKLQPQGFFIRYASEAAGSQKMVKVLNNEHEGGFIKIGGTKYYTVAEFYGEYLEYNLECKAYIRADLCPPHIKVISQYVDM